MTRTRAALFAILAVLAGVLGYRQYRRVIEEHEAAAVKAAAEVTLQALRARYPKEQEQAASLPKPDFSMSQLPKAFPRPVSAWQAAEKTFYENILSAGRFDVLVVPFQVQEFALDRSTRSLMTAELALAIGSAGKKVPDPYLVARALGDGQRRLNADDVYRLANKLHVGRIVQGYVGYSGEKKMRVTIQQQGPSANASGLWGDPETRHFEGAAFSADDPPIEAYGRLLPELLKTVGLDMPASAGAESRRGATALPSSPLGMAQDDAEPAREACIFQLLAALTPAGAERTRERFTEKSMLAVQALSPASPGYRVLRSRALMQMGYRPAALKALGTPESDEGRHLLALLNGNLPDVERYAPRVTPGIRALIAKLELNNLAAFYATRTQQESLDLAKSLKLPGRSWPFLAARAFTDWDIWSQFENASLKELLDRDFPIPGFTVDHIVRGGASLGDISRIRTTLDLSVLDHVRKYSGARARDWCCAPLASRFTDRDYLDLLEAIGNDNLVRRANLMAWNQRLPQDTLDFLERIAGAYRDHPQLTVARARAELLLAQGAQGAAQAGLQKSAHEHAANAYYWEQGQTRTAAAAWSMARMGIHYASDIPFHPFFPTDQGGNFDTRIIDERTALENSAADFGPVTNLSSLLGDTRRDWGQVEELLKSIEGRFAGNPQRPLLLAKNSARKGDLASAERYYREGIKVQPRSWPAYMELGKILFERAEVAKAQQLLMSYPGFREDSSENAVALSNDAFIAGSLFYWSGNFEQAMPLYRIASELQTGSNSSLASDIRIALAKTDYGAALVESRERARRYNSEFGYRDYIGLLHAMDHSAEAWDAFNALVAQMDKPEIWETPLVGHRRAGASESEIVQWVGSDPVSKSGYAGMYLLRAGVTDRVPSPDLAAAVAAVERPVWKLETRNAFDGYIVRGSPDGVQHLLNSKEIPGESKEPPGGILPLGLLGNGMKSHVKSDLVYFAEAYRLMQSGDYRKAKALLDEALALYDARITEVGYLLPYYAFAAARSGDTRSLAAQLEKFEPPYQRFDYYLARAVTAGFAGKTSESLRDLKLALYRRPFTRNRPVYSEYEFGEIAEWLFQATKKRNYREVALNWAKSVEQFSPWFAWPYAMEAGLATSDGDRERAIAMAFYLDPKSERLRRIAKSEINAAVKAFAGRNPFLRKQEAPGERSARAPRPLPHEVFRKSGSPRWSAACATPPAAPRTRA